MKNSIVCLIVCACVVVSSAKAQPFAVVDSSLDMYGGGAGMTFCKSKVQPGFFIGAFHSYSMEQIRPDMEAYGALGISTGDWYIMPMLGAGMTVIGDDPKTLGSARTFLIITQTTPVAFRTDSFVMWMPNEKSWFLQQQVGPSIRLSPTDHRLFPYLAAGFASLTREVSVSPGCKFVMNF